MSNCKDSCRPGFIPGPPAPGYTTGCSLADNPTFKTYVLPASVGDDKPGQPYAPHIGEFTNAIVIYEANSNIYFYDSLGTPTQIENGADNTLAGTVQVLQTALSNETTNRIEADKKLTENYNALQTQVDNIEQGTGGGELKNKVNSLQEEISSLQNNKQDTLVSGVNTKTINGQSILGSGDIKIEAGTAVDVVQTTGTSMEAVMSQDAVTKAIGAATENTRVDITQTAGESTSAVMSQKATTDLVANAETSLQTNINANMESINTLNTRVTTLEGVKIQRAFIQALTIPVNTTTTITDTIAGDFEIGKYSVMGTLRVKESPMESSRKVPSLALYINNTSTGLKINAYLTNENADWSFPNSVVELLIVSWK